MASQLTITVALVAALAVHAAAAYGPFGMGAFDGGLASAVPAAAASVDSARAAGHALAAENRATDAMIDRATGNPIGAAINENRAIGHSVASNIAAQRSTGEAMLANGAAGSLGAAVGANVAANVAASAAGRTLGAAGPLAAAGYGPYGGYGAYPGAYGAAYGYPYGAYGTPGFVGPLGYGAGMNRLASSAAAGAAIANGIAGSSLASTAAGVGSNLGVSS